MTDTPEQPEQDWSWRLVKKKGTSAGVLELGTEFQNLSTPEINFLIRSIGEGLIKIGTEFLQSHVTSEDDEEFLDEFDD